MKKYLSSISVVVPVYNSEKTLNELVNQLKDVLANFHEFEIILVDDASMDTSLDIVRKLVVDNKYILGVALKENSGQQSAILCGLRHAKYDYTIIIDDDLEKDPTFITELYEKALEGYDVVYAISPNKNIRSAGSFMRDMLFSVMTNIPKGIKVSSFRILNKTIREAVIKADTKFVYISMEILKATSNIANITTKSGPRAKSNYSLLKLIKLYYNIISTYRKRLIASKAKINTNCYEIKEIVGERR